MNTIFVSTLVVVEVYGRFLLRKIFNLKVKGYHQVATLLMSNEVPGIQVRFRIVYTMCVFFIQYDFMLV